MSSTKVCLILLISVVAATAKKSIGRGSGGTLSSVGISGSRSRTLSNAGRTRTYTVFSSSPRNYNSGARYYMRRTTSTSISSTGTFGYTYYRSGPYYYSGYGYRMYYPPGYYSPVYTGTSMFYFPPMFIYYYLYDPYYWNRGKPRFVCRNDYAFWPLENQTSEFVGSRAPSVNLKQFDNDLPDPDDSSSYDEVGQESDDDLTVIDSLSLNQMAFNLSFDSDFNFTSMLETRTVERTTSSARSSVSASTDKLRRSTRTMYVPTYAPNTFGKTKILAYNYFACPDGKDPDETYCCGPTRSQFCCSLEEFGNPSSLDVSTMFVLINVGILAALLLFSMLLRRARYRLCLLFGRRRQSVSTTVPSEQIPMGSQSAYVS